MPSAEGPLELVGRFLRDFYHDEPSNDRAASAALRAQTGDTRARWGTAVALRAVLEEDLPAGTLMRLVGRDGNRLAVDDDDARAFLRLVFDDNAYDVAWDPDDLD